MMVLVQVQEAAVVGFLKQNQNMTTPDFVFLSNIKAFGSKSESYSEQIKQPFVSAPWLHSSVSRPSPFVVLSLMSATCY